MNDSIPPDDGRGAYTDRTLRHGVVEKREQSEWADGLLTWTISSEFGTVGVTEQVYDLLPEGKGFIMETRGISLVTGWVIDGRWYDRKTDEDLAARHEAMVAEFEQRKRDRLDAHRAEWQQIQDALPDWIRVRLEHFHEHGGEHFALDGWGYELTVAELAVAYAAMGDSIIGETVYTVQDSDEVRRIAEEQGTSGNQHDIAFALAKAHLLDPAVSLAGTVSALSPITGDAFYTGTED